MRSDSGLAHERGETAPPKVVRDERSRERPPAQSEVLRPSVFYGPLGPSWRESARQLHGLAGNRATGSAVRRRLAVGGIRVSTPTDPAEVEAAQFARESVASAAVHPRHLVQLAEFTASPSGAGLSPPLRRFLEQRLGGDLGDVRLYSGAESDVVAGSLDAHAYTAGTDIAVGGGQLRRSPVDTLRLLAHEAAHVALHRSDTVVYRDFDPLAAGMTSAFAPASMIAPAPPGPMASRRTIEFQGRYLTDDPDQIVALLRAWATSGDVDGLESFVQAFRASIEEDRSRVHAAETFRDEASRYPTDVSGTPWSPEEFTTAAADLQLKQWIAPLMDEWLNDFHVRVDEFRRLVVSATQVRIEQNRIALSQWRAFIETQITPEQLRGEAVAERERELLMQAIHHPAGSRGREFFELHSHSASPARRAVYERVIANQIHGGCQYCHEITQAIDVEGSRTETPLAELTRFALREQIMPARSPEFAKRSGVPKWAFTDIADFPDITATATLINQIAPYLRELGPDGYKVLPQDVVSSTATPMELRNTVVAAIERRRADYQKLSAEIGAPGFDYMQLRPTLNDLLPVATPDVQGAVQAAMRKAGDAAEAEALVMAGLGLAAMLLTIFPPTAPIGMALGAGLSAYGFYQGLEAIELGRTLMLSEGSTNVFDTEQQGAVLTLMAVGAVNVVLSALDLGKLGVGGVKLIWRGGKAVAAGAVLEGVEAETGANRIQIAGMDTERPMVRVTRPDGTPLYDGPLEGMLRPPATGQPLAELPKAPLEGLPNLRAGPPEGLPPPPASGQLFVDVQSGPAVSVLPPTGQPGFLPSLVGSTPGARGVMIEPGDYALAFGKAFPAHERDLAMARLLTQHTPTWPSVPPGTPLSRLPPAPHPWELDPSIAFPSTGRVTILREPAPPGVTPQPAAFFPPRSSLPGEYGGLIPENQAAVARLVPTTHPQLHGQVDRLYWRRPFALQSGEPAAIGQEMGRMLKSGGFVEFRLLRSGDRAMVEDIAKAIGGKPIEVSGGPLRNPAFLELGQRPPGLSDLEWEMLSSARPDIRGEYGGIGGGDLKAIIRVYKP
jgi:hypothetical protein